MSENKIRAQAILTRVRALADQWDETPDYTATDYDRGRVEQRHDMLTQLLEALEG